MSLALAIALYAAWSSIFSLGKSALQYASPLFLTGSRMALAGAILLLYLLIAKRSCFKNWGKKQLLSMGLLGFFGIYLANTFEFWGLQHLTAAKTCFIYSLSPFFAVFFSYLHFKEKMTFQKWIGLSIGFLGSLPVLLTQDGKEELFQIFTFLSWPTLAVIGASVCSVYGWVLLRLIVKEKDSSLVLTNGSSMLFGGLLAFAHSFMMEGWNPPTSAHLPAFALNLSLMTLISNIVCYNLYGMLLRRYTATFLSFIGLLSPIFASFNSWLLLGEPLSWQIFLSTGVVSLGLWVVYRAELRQGYILQNSK